MYHKYLLLFVEITYLIVAWWCSGYHCFSSLAENRSKIVHCFIKLFFFVFLFLIWRDSSIHKYSLIKAKLQLQNNDPKLQTKNKNDLKYFLYYNYKIFV